MTTADRHPDPWADDAFLERLFERSAEELRSALEAASDCHAELALIAQGTQQGTPLWLALTNLAIAGRRHEQQIREDYAAWVSRHD